MKHILVAMDVSGADRAFERAMQLAHDAKLTVMHVIDDKHLDDNDPDVDDRLIQQATMELERHWADKTGEFFILGGQMAFVAALGDEFRTDYGRPDRRLRVVFDNGTESDLLLRSFQRALYKDDAGRRITDPSAGPLFGGAAEDEDLQSGTIYVLRSNSNHPEVAAHRNLIHKLGVTGGRWRLESLRRHLTLPIFLRASPLLRLISCSISIAAGWKTYCIACFLLPAST